MSARYTTVVAMLDNDANFACVIRELCRRGELEAPRKMVLPPIETDGGTLCYMSFRWHLQFEPKPDVEDALRDDILAEIWKDPSSPTPIAGVVSSASWWVTLQDGTEVGPFQNKKTANAEALRMLTREGWIILQEEPWDKTDAQGWPLAYR